MTAAQADMFVKYVCRKVLCNTINTYTGGMNFKGPLTYKIMYSLPIEAALHCYYMHMLPLSTNNGALHQTLHNGM